MTASSTEFAIDGETFKGNVYGGDLIGTTKGDKVEFRSGPFL